MFQGTLISYKKNMKSKIERIIKSKMALFGVKQCDIEKRTGIKQSTYYSRLSNGYSLRIGELMKLDKVLHFSDEEILEIVRGK